MRGDRRHRPALDADGPRRLVRRQRHEGGGLAAAHEKDPFAAEHGRIVEAARVPESERPVQLQLHGDTLSLAHLRRLSVEGELDAPRRRSALLALDEAVDLEHEPRAIGGPAPRLLGQPALHRRRRAQGHPRDVIRRQRRRRPAKHAEKQGEPDERHRRHALATPDERGRPRDEEDGTRHQEPRRRRRDPGARPDPRGQRRRERRQGRGRPDQPTRPR